MRGEELSLSDGLCSHGLCLYRASPGNAAAPHQQQQRPATGPCSAAGAGAAVFAVSWSLPRAKPSCGKKPPPGLPAAGAPPATSLQCEPSRAEPSRLRAAPSAAPEAACGRREGGSSGKGGSGPARCRHPPDRPYPRPPLGGTSPPGMSRRSPCPVRGRASRAPVAEPPPPPSERGPARSGCPRRGPSLHPVPVSPVLPLTPPASKSDLG